MKACETPWESLVMLHIQEGDTMGMEMIAAKFANAMGMDNQIARLESCCSIWVK